MRTTAINCWLFDHYGAMLNPIGRCRVWLDLHIMRLRWRWHVTGRQWIKRGFDVVVCASVLVVFSPLAGLIALLLKLKDGSPVLVAQTRVGKYGREFNLYKFPPTQTPRRFLLDELPQFYNVLKGEMSLVGPRPALPGEVARYTLADRRRLAVAPGITGLWRIGEGSAIGFSSQVNLDLHYIESQNFREDVIILLKTIPGMLSGKGACGNENATRQSCRIICG